MQNTARTYRRLTFALLLSCAGVLAFGLSRLNWPAQAALQSGPTSADGVWQELDPAARRAGGPATFRLNADALIRILNRAPREYAAPLSASAAVLTLPLPDGSFARFRIEDSPILQPDLAARLPDVKTFRGQGVDDPTATVRFDWTPQGLHALMLSAGSAVVVEPRSAGEADYLAYTNQALRDHVSLTCGVTETDVARSVDDRRPDAPAFTNGSMLRTYRLAVASSGEYTQLYGGGNVVNTQTAITSVVNLVNAIYERELAVRFTLVNNTNIIFTNAATDPYSSGPINGTPFTGNSANGATLTANQTTLDNAAGLGTANYDIGHVFGGILGLPGGSASFSGLAQLNVVCVTGSKGRGVSTMGGLTATLGIFIQGIAHEFGHQFSARHTANGTQGNCGGGNRDSTSAYESGSGSTIMSYAGTCDNDDIVNNTDGRFHTRSFEQMLNFITATATCATTAANGNTPPTVDGGLDFTIPRNTPFTLTATGNDANGDMLTFVWEQIDNGGASFPQNGTEASYNDAADSAATTRPIFRAFPPVASPARTFPSLNFILNNANDPPQLAGGLQTAEELPRIGRTLNFRVTARDSRAGGGGVTDDAVVITVNGATGPFLVTAPNTAVSWAGGSTQTVSWSLNGTNALAANVRILLSTDGGNTFPTVLLAGTANDGSENITVPSLNTTTARIRVEAVGNIFFDISNVNFTITPGGGTCQTVSGIAPTSGAVGSQVVINGTNFNGVTAVRFTNNVNAPNFNVDSATQISVFVPAGAATGPITISKTGCTDVNTGTFTVNSNCPTITNINPTSGAVGSQVVLTGSNFTGDTQVTFSNNVGATFTTQNSMQITATVPAGAVTGPISIRRLGDPCAPSNSSTFTVNAGCPTITITPPTLPAGTRNVAYNQTLTGNGGTGPYTFSLTAGTSVNNTFNATGPVNIPDNNPTGAELPVTVSGISSAITKVTVSLHLTHTFDGDLALQLIGPDATAVNLSVNRGGNGQNYGTSCAARTLFDDAAATAIAAGAAPFVGSFRPEQVLSAFNGKTGAAVNGQWRLRVVDNANNDIGAIQCVSIFITQTQPAPGLVLNANGTITGTPTTAGLFNFTVRATDANNCMREQQYGVFICADITVNPQPVNGVLPNGMVGTAYSQPFTQTGGGGTITWSNMGALPAGLMLNSMNGLLSGTPLSAGQSTFTIQAQDIAGCVGTRSYTITVTSTCPTITNINPTSGLVGAQVVITGSNFTGDTEVRFSNNVIATFTTNSSTQITATVPAGAVTGPISIRRLGDANCPTPSNSGTFTVTAPACPTVTNIAPTSGPVGSQVVITGTNFTGVNALTFSNNVNAPTFTVNSATQITVTVPAGAVTGPIMISKPGCANVNTATFTVTADPCTTFLPIAYGQTLTGVLQVGDCTTVFNDGSLADLYTFNGTVGDQIAIALNSSAFNAYLALFNAAGTSLIENDNGGGGNNARIPPNTGFFTLPATGAYRIAANTFPGQAGAYSLSLSVAGDCTNVVAVNSLTDVADATPGNGVCETMAGNGVCTLRAAIQEANALPACAPFTINFSVNGTINLTSALPNLDHPNLTINGPGANLLTVQRNTGGTYRIFLLNASRTATLSGLTIANGSASGFGGGISNLGTLTVNQCVLTGNTAVGGGGIHNMGTLTVANSTLAANTAPQIGFGLGGGLYNAGTATVTGSTISGNTGRFGGGVANVDGVITLTNCTISGNTANSDANQSAGGLDNTGFGVTTTATLLNCTFSGNQYAPAGGNATGADDLVSDNRGATATVTMKNTILAGNAATAVPNATLPTAGTGVITSQGNNLSSDNTPASFTQPGDQRNVNPLLDALANNGGLTQTHALLPGSPAINRGTNTGAPATDQRGIARLNVIDIGAYESRGFTLAITGGDNQATQINTAFPAPLTVSLTSPNGEPVNGGRVTFSAPNTGTSCTFSSNPAVIANGQASVNATANGTEGMYNVGVNTSGASGLFYTLTNNPPGGGNGLQFYPLARPLRLLDTRADQNLCDNIGVPITGGTALTTQARITCNGITIPPTAQAIVGNVTVINQTASFGVLTLFPAGQTLPLAANIIYEPGQLLSNNFTVGLSANGEFSTFAERTLHTVIDVSGYFAPPGAGGLFYHALPRPLRLMDTRPDQSLCDSVGLPITGGTALTTQARISCNGLTIPTAAQAIVGNATVINQTAQFGVMTLFPSGQTLPLAANMIYTPGQLLANAFTVGLSANGQFDTFAERTLHLVIDVAGYYSTEANDANGPGLLFNPLPRPLRLLDTRPDQSLCDNVGVPIAAGTSLTTQARITCNGITIPTAAQAVNGNITVINQTASFGVMTLFPAGQTLPLAANMIYAPGQLLANAFVVGLNAGGQFNTFGERTIHVVIDVSGYFAP